MAVEVGVLAPRMVDVDSVSGTTTDAYVDALSWLTRGMGKKTIVLKNTHALNSLTFRVLGRAQYTAGQDAEVIAPAPVIAGDVDLTTLSKAYDQVTVQVISTVAGNAATYQLDYNGVGET